MTFPTTRNKPIERVVTLDGAALQWASGKTEARSVGTSRWAPLIGFHIESNRDEAIDDALRAAGVPLWEIKHRREGGTEIKQHWMLGERVAFYPLTAGPVATTIEACLLDRPGMRAAGLGIAWPHGEKSRFAVRGYLSTLLELGCTSLVTLGVRSLMTQRLLNALLDHTRVCEVADGLIDRTKHPAMLALHQLALPLGAGADEEWGKTSSATVTPLTSLHPGEVGVAYIRSQWRGGLPKPAQIDEDWKSTLDWAATYGEEALESVRTQSAERGTEDVL